MFARARVRPPARVGVSSCRARATGRGPARPPVRRSGNSGPEARCPLGQDAGKIGRPAALALFSGLRAGGRQNRTAEAGMFLGTERGQLRLAGVSWRSRAVQRPAGALLADLARLRPVGLSGQNAGKIGRRSWSRRCRRTSHGRDRHVPWDMGNRPRWSAGALRTHLARPRPACPLGHGKIVCRVVCRCVADRPRLAATACPLGHGKIGRRVVCRCVADIPRSTESGMSFGTERGAQIRAAAARAEARRCSRMARARARRAGPCGGSGGPAGRAGAPTTAAPRRRRGGSGRDWRRGSPSWRRAP